MNSLRNTIGLLLLVLISFNCKNKATPEIKTVEVEAASQESKTLDPNATYAKAEFTIDGMTCAIGCAKTIEKKIAGMDGVKSAAVDFDRKLAMVEYNEAKVTPASLETAVSNISDAYKVSNMNTVEVFAPDAEESSLKCNPDCTKKDCADCKAKTDACKATCEDKTKAEKMACAQDSKKTCCAKKSQA